MRDDVLHILAQNDVSDEVLESLRSDFLEAGFDTDVSRREGGPMASFLLLVPTLIVVYLAKPFFEALAKKAGEDAYPHLKGALAKVATRLSKVRAVIVGKQPDAKAEKFSFVVSFYSTLRDGRPVKFLVEKDLSDSDRFASIREMVDLLEAHFADDPDDRLLSLIGEQRKVGRLAVFEFDRKTMTWSLVL